MARAGYASRGVVYLIIGFFALLSAFGSGSRKDTKGALQTVLEQPFGQTLIIVMIVGLAGYVAWRLVQSLFDTDDHGYSAKGLAVRAGLLASAGTYAVLALYAARLLGVTTGTDDGSGAGSLSATMSGVLGRKPVLICMALVFAGVAIAHWYKAATQRYADHMIASERLMTFVHPVSMIGLFARGSVFMIIGFLLILRVMGEQPDSRKAPGLSDVLSYLHGLPAGRWLLAAMAVGLILFAGYSLIEAVWRRINLEDAS